MVSYYTNIPIFLSSTYLFSDEVKEELLRIDIERIKPKLECTPTLFVFGQNCHSKALFANVLLGQAILPLFSSKWRCVSKYLIYLQAEHIL